MVVKSIVNYAASVVRVNVSVEWRFSVGWERICLMWSSAGRAAVVAEGRLVGAQSKLRQLQTRVGLARLRLDCASRDVDDIIQRQELWAMSMAVARCKLKYCLDH